MHLKDWLLILCFPLCCFAQQPSADTANYSNEPLRFQHKQIIAPTIFFASGLSSLGAIKWELAQLRNDYLPNFYTDLDDPLSLSPIFLTYLLDAVGMQAKTDFWNRSAILAKAELMMLATVYPLKFISSELRPDGSDRNSFPSSHTAQAFLGATLLSTEFGTRYKWVPYLAYGTAASVGLLRIANNKHYLPDVLIGAGIGILSQKISYWTHQYKWKKRSLKQIKIF